LLFLPIVLWDKTEIYTTKYHTKDKTKFRKEKGFSITVQPKTSSLNLLMNREKNACKKSKKKSRKDLMVGLNLTNSCNYDS
jgi:hypothetical protein